MGLFGTQIGNNLSGGGSSSPLWGSFAVEFLASNQGHVNHGSFLKVNTDYTAAVIEFFIKPLGGQYFLSPGEGGAHAPALIGVNGDDNGYTISGNTWDNNNPGGTSFATTEKIRHDAWGVVTLIINGEYISVLLNGVPSSIIPYTGVMRIANLFETVLYIGGSDHQNFTGRIAGWRMFINESPLDPFLSYRPELSSLCLPMIDTSGTEYITPTVAVPYFTGSLEDFGKGLEKDSLMLRHNGYLAEASDGFGDNYNRIPAFRPIFVVDPFEWPTAPAPEKPQIPNTRIFEDFSKPDVTKGNSATLGLGVTRVGNKTWVAPNYGILNGNAYGSSSNPGSAWITDPGFVDGSVIWKRPTPANPGAGSAVYRCKFRGVDVNNYILLYVDTGGFATFYQVVAGNPVILGDSATFTAGWTEIKVTYTGPNVELFRDGVSVTTRVMTENLTGTSKGFEFNSPYLRFSEFGVI